MPAFIEDTFAGATGNVSSPHVGESGVTWTFGYGGVAADAQLTGAGRVRADNIGPYLLSSQLPAEPDYYVEIEVEFNVAANEWAYASIFMLDSLGSYEGMDATIKYFDPGAGLGVYAAMLTGAWIDTGLSIGAPFTMRLTVSNARLTYALSINGVEIDSYTFGATPPTYADVGFSLGNLDGGGDPPVDVQILGIVGAYGDALVEPDYAPPYTGPFGGAGAYDGAAYPNLHAYPSDLPPFLRDGHIFEDVGVAEDIAFERGEDRARQMYTFNPQMVSVTTDLTQDEFDRFIVWYENDLRAGTLRFDVSVADQGGTGASWWASQFVGIPQWEAFGWYYIVTARLLLLDGPHTARTAPGLRGSTSMVTRTTALLTAATLRGTTTLTTTLEGRLGQLMLRGETVMNTVLEGFMGDSGADPDGRITEESVQRAAEDGFDRIQE